MTPLKRTIATVELYVATNDPEAIEKVKRILDAACQALRERNATRAARNAGGGGSIDFLESLLGGKR